MPRVSFSRNARQRQPARSSFIDTNGAEGHSVGAVDLRYSLWKECAPDPVNLSEKKIWSCFALEQQSNACTEVTGVFLFVFFCNVILAANLLLLREGTETYLNFECLSKTFGN